MQALLLITRLLPRAFSDSSLSKFRTNRNNSAAGEPTSAWSSGWNFSSEKSSEKSKKEKKQDFVGCGWQAKIFLEPTLRCEVKLWYHTDAWTDVITN